MALLKKRDDPIVYLHTATKNYYKTLVKYQAYFCKVYSIKMSFFTPFYMLPRVVKAGIIAVKTSGFLVTYNIILRMKLVYQSAILPAIAIFLFSFFYRGTGIAPSKK